MPVPPRTGDAVVDLVRRSGLADDDVLNSFFQQSGPLPPSAADTASQMVRAGILTQFQATAILQGKHRGFHLGHYKILDKIGVGGMGQVFLAEHVKMKRLVALKILPGRKARDPANIERFYREARAVAALDHPNIIRAHDVACDKTTHYLVLEYIEGQSLAEKLAAAGGRLPIGEACSYVIQAAAGLQHAHEKGLAHRDIKPGNLLVDVEGIVKILDMGLARFFENESDRLTHRHDPGGVMGTADYVSPEQLVDSSTADHRTDIYSLGATLYHLVTGQPPFTGTTTAKLVAHQLHDVPTAHSVRKDVPEGLSEVIARMMEKDPDDRYQAAEEVIAALLPFTADGVPAMSVRLPTTTPGSRSTAKLPVSRAGGRIRSNRTRQLLLFAAIFLIVTLAAIATISALREDDPAVQNPPGGSPPDQPALPEPVTTLTGLLGNPEDAVFTTDGTRVIGAAKSFRFLLVWNPTTGKQVKQLELPPEAMGCRGLAILPDNRLASCSMTDPVVRIWDLDSGGQVRGLTAEGVEGFVSVATLPDGSVLATATDRTVRLWPPDRDDQPRRFDFPTDVRGLAVTPDGTRFLVGCADRRVRLWDIAEGKELSELPLASLAWRIAVSPDGEWAAVGSEKVVQLWHLSGGQKRVLVGPEQLVDGVAFSPDGRFVLAGSVDRGLYVWEFADGRLLGSAVKHAATIRAVVVSPRGTHAATTSIDGTVIIWRMPEGTKKE